MIIVDGMIAVICECGSQNLRCQLLVVTDVDSVMLSDMVARNCELAFIGGFPKVKRIGT
jgi:hypothetical protein